jgi:hypothetical protein
MNSKFMNSRLFRSLLNTIPDDVNKFNLKYEASFNEDKFVTYKKVFLLNLIMQYYIFLNNMEFNPIIEDFELYLAEVKHIMDEIYLVRSTIHLMKNILRFFNLLSAVVKSEGFKDYENKVDELIVNVIMSTLKPEDTEYIKTTYASLIATNGMIKMFKYI